MRLLPFASLQIGRVKSLLLPAVMACMALPAEAATYLVDFGSANLTIGGIVTWNNFTSSADNTSIVLLDTEGFPSIHSLTFNAVGAGTVPDNNASDVKSATPEPFNLESVIQDSIFNQTAGTFTLSNLDPELTYSFTFYSYVNRTDTRRTQFTINDVTVFVEPGNTSLGGRGGTATISNVSPDINGNIVFTADRASGGGNTWILNAVQITSVPEPSVALLGLVGAAAFGGTRRRRR